MVQQRIKGVVWPTTSTWKTAVRQAMAEQGIDGVELGKRCGVGKSTISALLSEHAQGSRLVPKIHQALGWSAPSAPGEAAQITGVIAENWDSMPESLKETIRNLIAHFRHDD